MSKILKSGISLLLMLLSFASCTTQLKTLENGKKIDNRLVGVWSGSEKDQQIDGIEKKWDMTRNADGTFVLDFVFTQNGRSQETQETGNWWVEGNKFYEFHEESGKTDIYTYSVLSENQIKFKSQSISVGMNNDSYEFIDTRKK
ncbi:MAG: lipocalin family protein [Kaistella sp.]